jgi:pilus assembly protein CpaF
MRPTRLVVGEVRQAEALDLLIAMNSGVPSMATLHANSAREAVTKLCTLPLLAGGNIGPEFVVPTVAGCVDIVVHTATDRHGRRKVREIAALSGRVENGTVELAEIYGLRDGALARCGGYPPHVDRFAAYGFDLVDLLRGGAAA